MSPGLAAAQAAHGPLRERVRRAGRPDRRRGSWSPSAGRTWTGTACSSTTACRSGRSTSGPAGSVRDLRCAAGRHAALPGPALRHHIETLRLKYRPTGGFCSFSLADAAPAVTWSILGHDARQARLPRGVGRLPARHRRGRSPPAGVVVGELLRLDVHVISDRREVIEGAAVSAVLSWPGGDQGRRWVGDARRLVRAGRHPAGRRAGRASGPLVLDLDLVAGDDAATNRYETVITRP